MKACMTALQLFLLKAFKISLFEALSLFRFVLLQVNNAKHVLRRPLATQCSKMHKILTLSQYYIILISNLLQEF